MTTWDTQEAAIGMRDIIAAIADKRINDLRPEASYAVVQSINREARSAQVLYMGDTMPVTVSMGSIEPAVVGETVRVGGLIGHRYIEDVLGNALMSGNDTRYAQIGHVHAGGGAIALDLDDLGDVDTETNPPTHDSVLGWNDVGGYWMPISIDLGTAFLPLSGGTITGPVHFTGLAPVDMGATLSVGGAVTGQSFTGVGSGLTFLNASQLQSGTIPVARFPSTIPSNTTGTAAAWTTPRLFSVTGAMSGSVLVSGAADINLAVALAPNSINLGSDTTGDYVANIIGTANQVITNTVVSGEGTVHTLSLPQNIHAAATPQFSRLTLAQATGTAPMVIQSQTLVSNLNVELLNGQLGSFYQNAGNLSTGTVPNARLTGAYTGITGLGTLTGLAVSGVTTFTASPTVAGSTVWHAGNDGLGSQLDAGLLGGLTPDKYATAAQMQALVGGILNVGLYDAAKYNGDLFSLYFDRPAQSKVTGLTIGAGDDPFSVSFAIEMPVIPQADVTAGVARRRLFCNTVQDSFLDVYRTGDDDYFNRATGTATTPNRQIFNPVTGFSIRARVRKTTLLAAGIQVIARHGSTATDEAWTLYMDTGKLVFRCSANGSTWVTTDVLTAAELDAIPGTADGTDFYVATTVKFSGTQVQCQGWYSVNGTTWLTAATVKSTAYTTTGVFDTASTVSIGGGTGQLWVGRIYWVDQQGDTDPNGEGSPLWRFDGAEHPYGGGVTYTDQWNTVWTLSSAAAITHANYQIEGRLITSGGTRIVSAAAFSYIKTVGLTWQIHMTWNPATDVMSVGQRSGSGVDLAVATPAWTDVSTTFAGSTMSTYGAAAIGQGANGASNWSFGGRMFRALVVKNAVTLLDLRNTNITTTGQMTVTPTAGPVMTLSHASMAMTTMPQPVWSGGPTAYRHNMYWIVASRAEVGFIDSDYSGRYDVDQDDAVTLANGDWIIALDPQFGAVGHETGTNQPLSQMVFQFVPFSTETYVKAEIQEHAASQLDPHSAAGYLKNDIANATYAPLVHTHAAEITGYIALHEQASDPHPQYLTQTEGDGRYLRPGAIQPYEPLGAVLAHEQKSNPHTQYMSFAAGNAAFAQIDHLHTGVYSPSGHTHPTSYEVVSTDGAQSARIFVGSAAPVNPLVGDLWIQTYNIALQPPSAPTGLTIATSTPTSITISWNAWDATVSQTKVEVDRSPDGSTGWVNILTDATSPFDTSVVSSGLNERTTYFYRVRGTNAIGAGSYGSINGITGNAAPGAPGGLSVSNVSVSAFRLNWSAVSAPAYDPLHATQPYEVFQNGVYVGATTGVFWDFSGYSENTSVTVGVRSKDNLGLTSTLVQVVGTTANAAPPAPTGLGFPSYGPTNVNMSWSQVTGISDLNRYQVYVNGGFWADVYTTSYNFTGLAYSTTYTFGVRTVDNGGAVSAISTISGTTAANPDTTPPGGINFRSFQPRNNYGEMYFEFDGAGDASYGIVYVNVNGAGWQTVTSGSMAGYKMIYVGTFGADQTIYAAVNYRDDAGNWTNSNYYAYTLVPSPKVFDADSSNSWRNTNGGEWNAGGGYRPIQGYYSNGALNSLGMWYYGTAFQDWWQNGRTITASYIFINREGCGNNVQDWITLYVHQMLSSPGTASYAGGMPYIAGSSDIGTVQFSESKWMAFPTDWMYQACWGQWRGFAIWRDGGKPYLCLRPAGVGYSGAISVDHLG